MKRQILTMTAIAMFATTSAQAQDMSAIEAGLNTEVYAMGMAELTENGFDVERVRQDRSGDLTFMAHTATMARVLVMDEDGRVVSDTMTDLSTGANVMTGGDDDSISIGGAVGTGIDANVEGANGNDNNGLSAGFGLDSGFGVTVGGDDDDGGTLGLKLGGGVGINLGL